MLSTPVKLQSAQKVEFCGNDDKGTVVVYGDDVTIVPSAGDHDTGSSKVKLKNIVDYTWEERFYTGQLLAVHMSGHYIAYGIKAASKSGGVVRVVNRASTDRALIKGMNGMVQDIAFAHIPIQVILACVDEAGNLFVHQVEEIDSQLICTLMLHVTQDQECGVVGSHRVIWCPFIPEEEQLAAESAYGDVAKLLALTRGTKAELWNVGVVISAHGIGPVKPGEVEKGYLEINAHTGLIVDAAFSPDGTAVATASLDGEVKFFQVYMNNATSIPRCLHQWQPHGGKPLSSLFFLDNHKQYHPDIQFWKYAISGADHNSELKVWSCESWTCLQTIRFSPRRDEKMKLKACLDLASGFLLLSDIYHRVLYVFQVKKDFDEQLAYVSSASEFLLPYPILSFGIVDAGIRRFKTNTSFSLDDLCNGDVEEECHLAVVVRMYLVQPKSLQECHIAFQPPKPSELVTTVNLPQDSLMFREGLSDLSCSVSDGVLGPSIPELPANHSALQLNLMTPDAFSSPAKHELSNISPTNIMNANSGLRLEDGEEPLQVSPLTPQVPREMLGFASGGSSPSREVQEILSLQDLPSCFLPDTDIEKDILQQTGQPELAINPPEEKPKTECWPQIPQIIRKNDLHKSKEDNRNLSMSGDSESQLWAATQRLEATLTSLEHAMQQLSAQQAAILQELGRGSAASVEAALSRWSAQHLAAIENAVTVREDRLRQNQEALVSAISQAVTNLVATKLDHILTQEINTNILPAILNSMEPIKKQLHVELTQKLSTTDHLLKENINKLVHSKTVMEVLSNSLVSALSPAMADCYRESFTSVAMPSFEKACNAMFSQINDTFAKGTKEYVAVLQGHSHKAREKSKDSAAELSASAELIKQNAQKLSEDIKKSLQNMESSLGETVSKALRNHQAALEGTMMAAVRSGAVTPAPHVVDTQLQQTQVLNLIAQGQINSAFQQALSASDLNLVVFVCEKVNPQQVFNQTPCPLQQAVLLSLVQQLSADLANHTELKHKYLEEAVMNLDSSNSLTREHLPVVLNNLQRQLQAYIIANPNNRITRSMKMLHMATQSLLKP